MFSLVRKKKSTLMEKSKSPREDAEEKAWRSGKRLRVPFTGLETELATDKPVTENECIRA